MEHVQEEPSYKDVILGAYKTNDSRYPIIHVTRVYKEGWCGMSPWQFKWIEPYGEQEHDYCGIYDRCPLKSFDAMKAYLQILCKIQDNV